MRDSFPLPRGRHHFFPKTSFNAALSSMASASNRFSRVFSSSSVFSRLASETSILRLPFVDAGVADAVLAAQIGDRNAGLVLLQYPNDLLFRKATALHALVLVMGQSELQPGLSPRGNVRAFPNSVTGLQPPDFARGGELPELSGRMPKYSRFRETAAGD
jgi:hypothetical protein